MSKINILIGEGNFSLIMKRIASILVIEFDNQIALGNTFLPNVVGYDNETAVNEGDLPFVSVNWLKFSNKDDFRSLQINQNNFFIDVKAVGYDVVRKIIAVIRTILKDEQYLMLDYPYGVVSDTNIVEAGISFEAINTDSQGSISGGLTYECLISEANFKAIGTELNETFYENIIDNNKIITLKNIY